MLYLALRSAFAKWVISLKMVQNGTISICNIKANYEMLLDTGKII